METGKIATQMISFQKNFFENTFNALSMIQEQSEKMTDSSLDQITWLPEEGKKAIRDAIAFCQENRANFKKSVDEGFARMEELFAAN